MIRLIGRMALDHALQGIAEVGEGLDVVELCALDPNSLFKS
jgi:hypothetical protein